MAAPAVLRLRDPNSYSYRGLRSPQGAALRGGTVNTGPLTCTIVTLRPASADVNLDPATALVSLLPASATVDLVECGDA